MLVLDRAPHCVREAATHPRAGPDGMRKKNDDRFWAVTCFISRTGYRRPATTTCSRAPPSTSRVNDRDVYLRTLAVVGAVDEIDYGHYVSRFAKGPLALEGQRGQPVLTTAAWQVLVRDTVSRSPPGGDAPHGR